MRPGAASFREKANSSRRLGDLGKPLEQPYKLGWRVCQQSSIRVHEGRPLHFVKKNAALRPDSKSAEEFMHGIRVTSPPGPAA